ncbi:hypothetical protein [Nesterenkonia flava]|uniref:Uncharacterized protein n=1 Tax=Nesterenkonia flava TaxID=469799 RepID=A0ABU1FQP1_9MICC|nr:hypothetical protein [Nesterenkonia flava]MDR5710954.1 hypothetical protein [Nesterenkonia flava]
MTNPSENPAYNPASNPGFGGGAPGNKYGTQAYDPNAVGQPMSEPGKYRQLKLVTIITAIVVVASGIFSSLAMGHESFRQNVVNLYSDILTQAEAETIADQMTAGSGVGGLVINTLITVILFALVIAGLYAKKNWGRILGIIFAIIGILAAIAVALFGAGFMLDSVWGILTVVTALAWIVLAIWWLVLAFSRPVKEYLAQFRV